MILIGVVEVVFVHATAATAVGGQESDAADQRRDAFGQSGQQAASESWETRAHDGNGGL